jgi:predicted short-subunit dehydrogenase-like oxidoreductase (DUF2520 family)
MNEIAIIGDGRMGRALTSALRAHCPVTGPLGRTPDVGTSAVVLLAVPDAAIAQAARAVPRSDGRLVGHVSGATTLAPLTAAGHEAVSLHPLMTVPDRPERVVAHLPGQGAQSGPFAGAGAAVAGSTDRATATATELATALGMTPFEVADADRAAYHAAASIASNYLVTLEAAAERLLGRDRALLAPLVRATVDNWERLGARRALTGPIARGDEDTVARQRAAVQDRAPDLLPLFDTLADQTRELAAA